MKSSKRFSSTRKSGRKIIFVSALALFLFVISLSPFLTSSVQHGANSGPHPVSLIDDASLDSIAKIHMRRGYVYLQLVTNAYLDLTLSWICNAHPSVLGQTIFFTFDETVKEILANFIDSSHVFVSGKVSSKQSDLSYGQLEYYKLMETRARFVLELLLSDINVWIIESDAVWFGDPSSSLKKFQKYDVLTGQDGELYENIPEAGFIFLRSTSATLTMWTQLHRAHKKRLEALKLEQVGDLGNEMLMLPAFLKHVKWTFFPKNEFVSGKWYGNATMRRLTRPVVIQNNWIIGNENKTMRAKEWGHWYLNSDRSCKERRKQ